MPSKHNKTNRKVPRGRKANTGPKMPIMRGVAGNTTVVPLQYRVKIPYAQAQSLVTSSTAVPFFKTWNGGGPQFPYTTNDGGNHQPLGFDQLAALYIRYRVVHTSYRVKFNNVSSEPISAAILVKPYNVATVLWSTVMEKAGKKRVVLTQKGDMKSVQTISGSFRPSDVLGVTPEKYRADDQYSALLSAIPAQTPFIQVYVSHHASTAVTTFVEVSIDYVVEFFEPVQLTGSVV